MLQTNRRDFLMRDRSRRILVRKWQQDPLEMSYDKLLEMMQTIEEPFRAEPCTVQKNFDWSSCAIEPVIAVVCTDSFIGAVSSYNIRLWNRSSLECRTIWNTGFHRRFYVDDGQRILVSDVDTHLGLKYCIIDLEKEAIVDQFYYGGFCHALCHNVVAIGKLENDRCRLKLRWFRTKIETEHTMTFEDSQSWVRKIDLMGDYLILLIYTTCDCALELRPFKCPNEVTLRIHVQPFGALHRIVRSVTQLRDLFNEGPLLDMDWAPLVCQDMQLYGIRRFGKYALTLHTQFN